MLTDTSHLDFWGPASNFGIPLAAIADMKKDPEMYVPPKLSLGSDGQHTLPDPLPRSLCVFQIRGGWYLISSQYLGNLHRSSDCLLWNLHALFHGRYAEELPSFCLPFYQLQFTVGTRL